MARERVIKYDKHNCAIINECQLNHFKCETKSMSVN